MQYKIVILPSMFLQLEERQVGHVNIKFDIDNFVISQPKWLKFCLHWYVKVVETSKISAVYLLYSKSYQKFYWRYLVIS